MQSDQAAIDNAQAMLGYTTIVAPIDGRTGIRHGRRRQYRARLRRRPASSSSPRSSRSRCCSTCRSSSSAQVNDAFAKAPLAVEALRPDSDAVIDRGVLARGRQPGRSDHRHGEAQGRVSQCRPAALAGAVRQCAAVDRHAERRGGDPDRRGAARPERHLRLRGPGRQHGGDASGRGAAAGRDPDGDRRAACSPPSAWSPPASRGSPTAATVTIGSSRRRAGRGPATHAAANGQRARRRARPNPQQ